MPIVPSINRALASRPPARYHPEDLPVGFLFFAALAVVIFGHFLGGALCAELTDPFLPFVPWVNVETHDINPMHSARQYVYDHWVRKLDAYTNAEPYNVEWDEKKTAGLPTCEAGPGWHPWTALEDGEWQSIKNPLWKVEACAYAGEISMREYFPVIKVNLSSIRSLLRWQPSKCAMPILGDDALRKCFADRRVALAGDSIVREWYCFMRDMGIDVEYINHRYPTITRPDASKLPDVLKYDFERTNNPTRNLGKESLRDMCGRNSAINTDMQRGLNPNLTHIFVVPSTAHWLSRHSWKSVYLGKGPSSPMPLNEFTQGYKTHLEQLHTFLTKRQPNAKLVWTSPSPASFIEVNKPIPDMGQIRLGVCPSNSLPMRNSGTLRRSWNLVTHLSETLAAFVKEKGQTQQQHGSSTAVASNNVADSTEFLPNTLTSRVTNTTVKRTESGTIITTVTTIVSTTIVPNEDAKNEKDGMMNTFLNMTAVMGGRMDGNLGLTQRQRWDCTHTCPELARWAIQILAKSLGC